MRYKRGYLSEWCSAEGVVYEMYDPRRHDVDVQRGDFGADTQWYLSVDYGFKHPASVGVMGGGKRETHTIQGNLSDTVDD